MVIPTRGSQHTPEAVGYFAAAEVISMRSRLLLGFLILASVISSAQSMKLAPELGQTSGNQTVSLTVQYKPPMSSALLRVVISTSSSAVRLGIINAVKVTVPASSLATLAADPSVTCVSPDRTIRGHLNNAAPAIQANYAWRVGLNGTSIGIVVLGSGSHEVNDVDMAGGVSRIKASSDYTGEGVDDTYGHGTHVAGIIGGNGANSSCATCNVTINGIAPNVNLISFKVPNGQGQGTESGIIQAIQAAIQGAIPPRGGMMS
jgi:serine protease AprX